LKEVEVMRVSKRSWVGLSMNGSEGVSKVPLYETKYSTLKVQLMSKFGGKSTT